MKFMNTIKLAILSVATLGFTFASANVAAAIPYQPGANVGTTYPAFNVFTGTPSEGDENDFFKGKEESSSAPSENVVNSACTNGTIYRLRVYVHNSAQPELNQNGNGPGVARGTKVRVQLPNGEASNFTPSAVISANNAASVADNMTINCNGKKVKLSYVAGTAKQFTGKTGTKSISDSVVTTGAAVGSYEPNGDVWGCWDDRVWVTLNVKVEEVSNPPVASGVCKVTNLTTNNANRTVTVTVNGDTVNGATVTGYKTDFGDGTVSNNQTATHSYNSDGTYTIRSHVEITYPDGRKEWKTADACTKVVTFKKDQPPVVTPPTTTTPPTTSTTPSSGVLPEAGAGGIAAVFAAVTALSTLGYQFFVRRMTRG